MPRVIHLELAQAGDAPAGPRVIEQDVAPGATVTLGRGKLGMPRDEMMLSSNHAEVGWEKGVPVVRRLGKNQVGVRRHGERLRVQRQSCAALEDGDELFFLLESAGLRYQVTIVTEASPAKRGADTDGAADDERPTKTRRTEEEDDEHAWLEAVIDRVSGVEGIEELLPSGVRTNIQQVWASMDNQQLAAAERNFQQEADSADGRAKLKFLGMVEVMSAFLRRRRGQQRPVAPAAPPPAAAAAPPPTAHAAPPAFGSARPIFVCATGAGGGRSRQRPVLGKLGTLYDFDFTCGTNLTTKNAEAPALRQFAEAAQRAVRQHGRGRPVYLVGQSFGSRAAVHLLCREDMASDLPAELAGVVAFAYPLTHATQHRERKLAELPPSARVLFISGTRTIATPSRLVALPVSR